MPVSYDVKSLFTRILVEESLGICERKLREDNMLNERMSKDVTMIVRLLLFCLTTPAFQFKGTHYQQLDGITIGSPVSSLIADIFMENLEEKAFGTYEELRPWRRFVDNGIAIVTKRSERTFYDI